MTPTNRPGPRDVTTRIPPPPPQRDEVETHAQTANPFRLTPKTTADALKSFGVTLEEAVSAGILDGLDPSSPRYIIDVFNAAQSYKLSLRDPNEPNPLSRHRGQVKMGGTEVGDSWAVDGYRTWAVERNRIMSDFKISDKLTTEFVRSAHGGKTAHEFEDAGGTFEQSVQAMETCALTFGRDIQEANELPQSDGDLAELERKAAELPKGTAEDAQEGEIVEDPLALKEIGQQDGKDYAYTAEWTPESQRWIVALATYVKVWTDEETMDRNRVINSGLSAQRPGIITVTVKFIDAPIELVNKLRTEADKAIKEAWPELDSKERETERIDHLKAAWAGASGLGTQAALTSFGYNGAKQRVLRYCIAHTNEQVDKITERALATTEQSVTASASAPPMIVPSNSPIKVPTEAEWQLMDRFAAFAVRCKIYPNDSAAFLAIYRGFELGFGISTSIENIYAFEGKGGKIMTMPSANAYTAICLNSTLCERFSVTNDTDESAIAIVKRRGNDPVTYKYSKADANAAGLLGKPAWQSNLKAMLRHRVARQAAELVFADVCAAMGLSGAIGDDDLADAGDIQAAAGF